MSQERGGLSWLGALWIAFLGLVTILAWTTEIPEIERFWQFLMAWWVILPGAVLVGAAVTVFFGFVVGYHEGMPRDARDQPGGDGRDYHQEA